MNIAEIFLTSQLLGKEFLDNLYHLMLYHQVHLAMSRIHTNYVGK
jgi:hypothetical protein